MSKSNHNGCLSVCISLHATFEGCTGSHCDFQRMAIIEITKIPSGIHTKNVNNEVFWEQIDLLLYTMMPVMMLLCLADGNKAAMDKVYYYVRRIDVIMEECNKDFDKEAGTFCQTVFTCHPGKSNTIKNHSIPLVF